MSDKCRRIDRGPEAQHTTAFNDKTKNTMMCMYQGTMSAEGVRNRNTEAALKDANPSSQKEDCLVTVSLVYSFPGSTEQATNDQTPPNL